MDLINITVKLRLGKERGMKESRRQWRFDKHEPCADSGSTQRSQTHAHYVVYLEGNLFHCDCDSRESFICEGREDSSEASYLSKEEKRKRET